MLIDKLIFLECDRLELLGEFLSESFKLLTILNALLEFIGQLLALFLTELLSLAKIELLFSKVLEHDVLLSEPLVLFFILSFAGDVFHFEVFLDALRL